MNDVNRNSAFHIADWHVDPASNRLSKGSIEVRLEARVMAVLHYLASHPRQLVSRDTLEQAIWGNTVVGYDALTRCIAQLRKALDDDSREPRYIETIPKKGYRLVAPVSGAATPSAQVIPDASPADHIDSAGRTPRQGSLWIATLALLLSAILLTLLIHWTDFNLRRSVPVTEPRPPSIVVLPFSNLSDTEEHAYFSAGITADITTALSKLSGLHVISHGSAIGYQDTATDSRHIAGSLGVQYILEGSIRRTDARIRVNVNLVDSGSNTYLWSEKYDAELSSVFDVQDDITAHIIQALAIQLTQEEKRRTARKYTASIEAYDDFLRGQAYYMQHSAEDNRLAREYFQQAIDRDAFFARAYSAKALTYVADQRYHWDKHTGQALDHALQLAIRGRALNPELPQAYWVLGYVHLFRREYTDAATAARRAVELAPNYADSYLTLAICELHAGSPLAASGLVRKAMLINPRYPAAYASILGQAYFFSGDYEQAINALRDAIQRNNNLLTAHVFLIATLGKLDRLDDARWAAEQLKALDSDFSVHQVVKLLAVSDINRIDDLTRQLQRVGL